MPGPIGHPPCFHLLNHAATRVASQNDFIEANKLHIETAIRNAGVFLSRKSAKNVEFFREQLETGKLKIKNNNLQVFAGLKNIFNSYQDDFEKGINRYPGYIYGPRLPRTVFIGLKFGKIK